MLVIVLAQEDRHIVSSCRGKQRCIFPAEGNHARGDWRSVKGHAAYLGIMHQHHTGHKWGVALIPCRCLTM
jgi:hypothetical protein